MTGTPTTIFTGFLGSGKTTIISHLIDELQQAGQQVVFIKNEIGSANIDSQLMQGKHIQTRELLNGCICCTLVGPFLASITEVIDTLHPDRIIIEASGAADPAAIALMVASHPRLWRDGVIGVIDVLNFEGYKDISFTAQQQAKFTDLILFNKVELADLHRKQAVVGYVRELNPTAPIIETHQGRVRSELIFGLPATQLDQLLHAEHTDHSHHLATDHIQTFSLSVNPTLTLDQLQHILEQLPKNVFRVKGVVTAANQPQPYLVNKVGQRTELTPLETSLTAPLTNTLVIIGFEIEPLHEQLTSLFSADIKLE